MHENTFTKPSRHPLCRFLNRAGGVWQPGGRATVLSARRPSE